MRTAVISDIHGNLEALRAVLHDIDAAGVDRVICLGDCIDGGGADLEVVRELMRLEITCVRGNHDEFCRFPAKAPEAAFLGSLGDQIREGDVLYTHISPRPGDRKIGDRFEAWNVFDETPHRLVFVGHVHVPLLFREAGTAGTAEVIAVQYGRRLELHGCDRYIVCPGSVALSRDGIAAPRYVVYDDTEASVEFRMVEQG
jgi:predicted phosphodiesterase